MKRFVTLAFLALAGFLAVYAFLGAPAIGTEDAAASRSLPAELAAQEASEARSDTGAFMLDLRLWDLLGLLTVLAVALAAQRALTLPDAGGVGPEQGLEGGRRALRTAVAGAAALTGLALAAWNVFGAGSVMAGGGFIAAALTGYSMTESGEPWPGPKFRLAAELVGFLLIIGIGVAGAAGEGFFRPASPASLVILALGTAVSAGFMLYAVARGNAGEETA
ncbi:MAG: hypothetical protein ACYC55_07100 [Candidatus Geothermincolia bacterium]